MNTKRTQKKLADVTGIVQPDISRIVAGKKNLGKKRAKQFAEIVGGCPMVWMFEERAAERPALWAAYQEGGNRE